MKTASIVVTVFAMFFVGCVDKTTNEHGQEHEAGGLEPLAYTVYSDKTELFVEFKPLVAGSKSVFAAHLTILGERFLPLSRAKVTVSLIVGENGIRTDVDSASSPGIFRLVLVPKTTGTGKLIFDIEAENYTDQIVIPGIKVYAEEKSVAGTHAETAVPDETVFLKEQAWKIEFANAPVEKRAFSDIIKTSGQILSAPDDEMVVTANASGIVRFTGNSTVIGSAVSQNTSLFVISGGNLTENNPDARYKEAKANYLKTKADYERAKELVNDKIISQAAFLQAKNAFENAQTVFNAVDKNYSASGQAIVSPITGFVKNIMVSEGRFVEAGTPLAVVSGNKKLILQAGVSQKYFSELSTVSSANFKPAGYGQVYSIETLNGKMISYGKSSSANSAFLPVTFEFENNGNLVPGSAAEVYLKSAPIPNALVIPVSSVLEEQGNYYVYVQTGGESFQKREITLGASDGENVQVLSGIEKGERVVTKGAYQIKLSSASGELPAHGHEH